MDFKENVNQERARKEEKQQKQDTVRVLDLGNKVGY